MKLTVVGIGSGAPEQLTPQALTALQAANVVVGYTRYIELIKPLLSDKKTLTTGMRGEEERCRMALECAMKGERTAVVCSGDAGVYGLASLLIAMAENTGVQIDVIPGLTAALTGAALLGAPLNHDFCVISLSDLLTPWERIEKRLRAAAEGDFVIVLYNPMSRLRPEHLRNACDILLKSRSAETPVGVARNIGREGESIAITTLEKLREWEADMFTTVFIGSTRTRIMGNSLVTPRGYATEEV